ncbi:MAG: SpoIIIAH-like family protein [Oscillospiraceae bacterium]|nr:SpoIIIAH-like family protein [Oscillospiraceae bacterium]
MKLKQKLSSGVKKLKEKLKTVNAKRLLASRAFLISGCAVLIVAAVAISALVGKNTASPGNESESGKLLGNSVLVGEEVSGVQDTPAPGGAGEALGEPNDLLAVTVLNRTAVREDAMAVLQSIADNPDALPDEREDALAQIASIMDDMAAEANIEALALARGIPQCVAVISGKNCSVIVDSAEISEAECAQIVEIVYEQSGILPIGIKVILTQQQEDAA